MGARGPRLDDAEQQALIEQLATAWGREWGPGPAPNILLARDRQGRVIHVSVIWEAWAGVGSQQRAEIILEALRRAPGNGSLAALTGVVGLTPAEAGRRGR